MKNKLIFGALALLLFVIPEFTTGQTLPRPGYANLSAAELGARLCVNEGTWSEVDCAAILHIRRRSMRDGEDFKSMLIRLHGDESRDRHGRLRPLASLRSDRALRVHPRDNRPWIGDLAADGHTPLHWPSSPTAAPWQGRYQDHWMETVVLAQGVIDGTVPDPFRGSAIMPNTWGNRGGDHDRAMLNGYENVPCSGCANEYWRQ